MKIDDDGQLFGLDRLVGERMYANFRPGESAGSPDLPETVRFPEIGWARMGGLVKWSP